jgi:hypothetical protein
VQWAIDQRQLHLMGGGGGAKIPAAPGGRFELAKERAVQAVNNLALKEWAIVDQWLGSGRQVVLLRKGGIHEQRGQFEVEHREFFLFPTYVHQRTDDLIPGVHAELQAVVAAAPTDRTVTLRHYAVVEDAVQVASPDPLRALADEHILSWPAVEARFWYRNRPGLHVLLLRAYRLPRPLTIANLPDYDGCVSWVDLVEPLPTAGCTPVLGDAEFARRAAAVRRALAPPA